MTTGNPVLALGEVSVAEYQSQFAALRGQPALPAIEPPPSLQMFRENYPGPVPPEYKAAHPGKIVKDHIKARAMGGDPVDPSNIEGKPWEMNARKRAYEGQYLRDYNDYIQQGLSPEQAKAVLQGEADWLMNDVHARPIDPDVLDTLPAPSLNNSGG